MPEGLHISFFGSSLVSAFWNGAATYYRGIIRAMNERGHTITFFEPDAYDRQKHRDIPDPPWANIVVYPAEESGVDRALQQARKADMIVKASGVGVFDDLLNKAVLDIRPARGLVAFWDVDAAATLDRLAENPADPFHACVSQYDLILTHGGGEPVVKGYKQVGARECVPIHNALDPTTHFPVKPEQQFQGALAFLGNRRPDCEARVEAFFLDAAARLPHARFLLGGNGWEDKPVPENVHRLGHVYSRDHNAFNCTPRAVLNINRESMARSGYSPATRVFEAAGAGGCIITDAFKGIETFLQPDQEVLVAADGQEVADHLRCLSHRRACRIGERARARVLAEHTYAHRAQQLHALLTGRTAKSRAAAGVVAA